eukprot:CAMPEP_0183419078 /NCGR_PEP_ID=MMETSP0370-20130417/25547_1 /TAXON_ID=268820 /ORGANISM="Peridinium aciculiferum, Strain PAER-2" /LENGTH=122 /DNA_ID=CAMNT_0025602851 /DNA_START=53 /DNA_END=417 /DNA_ORIENTATION=-
METSQGSSHPPSQPVKPSNIKWHCRADGTVRKFTKAYPNEELVENFTGKYTKSYMPDSENLSSKVHSRSLEYAFGMCFIIKVVLLSSGDVPSAFSSNFSLAADGREDAVTPIVEGGPSFSLA